MTSVIARVFVSAVLLIGTAMIDYSAPIERALMKSGFRVIFISYKIYDGEEPERRPKIYRTKCGDRAYWSPNYPDNITIWLQPECEHDQTAKASAVYGDDVAAWVADHVASTGTRTFDEFVADVREMPDEMLVLTVKKIDPFQNR